MKTSLLLVSGMLCVGSWQASAQETDPPAQPTNAELVNNAQGSSTATNSMSGGPAALQGKTRADVYQDLVRSQQSGEAARLQELYKGGQ
ncbi:hypothetical protein [Paraburkholderia sp. BCC1884]|uniref:hypothetical protein n=1 Tax=Paraburkholderia sp. BCC1884 TaxID=2562668 RepID=UPI0011834272|nr:hypothetical protein [Paraburkholderia sp. BCC1884]